VKRCQRMFRLLLLAGFALLAAGCGGGGGDGPKTPIESNANLAALVLEQVTLVPAFSSRTTSYTADVPNAVTSTRVTPTAANPAATVRVNGTLVASGGTSNALPLAEGANTITTTVTAEDGTTSRTYTVNVTRRPPPSTNAALASLTLTVAPLDQIFDPTLTGYTASAGFFGTSTRVVAAPEDANATLELNGAALAAGGSSAVIPLAVGSNTLTVRVTAEDGTTFRTYTVEATRGTLVAARQEAYVKASNTGPDLFGAGVQVVDDLANVIPLRTGVSLAGDLLVAGAPREDSAATGINGNQLDNSSADAGAAYAFERRGTVWAQAAYVKASNTDSDDRFGAAIALDGDQFAVGAVGEDSAATGVNGDQSDNSASFAGAVYVFGRNASGSWRQNAYLKASNTEARDEFGSALSLNSGRLLVGAPFEDSSATGVDGAEDDNAMSAAGAAYLFEQAESGTWRQTAYLKASNTASLDQFGVSVAVAANSAAVGAWLEDGGVGGINGNQNDNSVRDAGAVYLFEADAAGDWSQAAYVKASNPRAGDGFGIAVALDGDLLAVGAPGQNSAASGINGNELDQSLTDAGAVYVFARGANGAWRQEAYIKASNPRARDLFGLGVALHGNLLAVGAPGQNSGATGINGDERDESARNAGAVYLFERNAAGQWAQIAYVKAANADPDDQFGGAVAASGDTLAAGAQFEQSRSTGVDGNASDNSLNGAGAVYVIR
jgi:trimeric autotransporter adhesin